MARYDRIARLDPPNRDGAFTGWLAVRDLAGREREADLGRRARLRFLAARLLHRLVEQGDGIDEDSLLQQVNGLREELGQLPGRDPEREGLAAFLRRLENGDTRGIIEAAFDLAEVVRSQGHPFAAEELYRTGAELAEPAGLSDLGGRAEREVATLHRPQRQI